MKNGRITVTVNITVNYNKLSLQKITIRYNKLSLQTVTVNYKVNLTEDNCKI